MISIHVPAWGTTEVQNVVDVTFPFQSTFPRGERPSDVALLTGNNNFNPRSRVGNDSIRAYIPCISIDFNPRSCVGNDGIDTWKRVIEHIFQSTFPRGERLASERHLRLFLYFNPRSRVGNDHSSLFRIKKSVNFNPRSRVGNDRQEYDDLKAKCISIHVPAWERL